MATVEIFCLKVALAINLLYQCHHGDHVSVTATLVHPYNYNKKKKVVVTKTKHSPLKTFLDFHRKNITLTL